MILLRRYLLPLTLFVVLLAGTASAQWKEVALPAPFNQGYYLDVFFMPGNENLGWACSIQGFIVRTVDGGKTWAGSSIPGAFLEYVQFVTPTIGFVSGVAGCFKSVDGGRSWRDISPYDPNGEKGWGSYWINQNVGIFFVGGCASGVQAFFRTEDGGDSWSVFYQSEPLSGLSDGLIFRDGSGFAVSSGVLWRTEDFGRTWRKFSSTGTKVWTEEIAVSGNSILLPTSGTNCDGETPGVGSMRFSADGGQSWSETQTGQNMFGTFLLDENRGWGAGENRTVLYTTDQGRTWENRNCGIRGNIDDIWFVNDTLGWAVGEGIYRSNLNAPRPNITINPPEELLLICKDDSVYLEASGPYESFRWDDGTVAKGRIVTKAGRYIVSAFDPQTCLTAYDTVRVVEKNAFEPRITSSAREICEGDSILLDVDGPATKYEWSSGETSRSIQVRTGGTYTCTTVDTVGCVRTAFINIIVHPKPRPNITANRSLTLCLDDVVTLTAPDGYRSYTWNDGSVARSITTGDSGAYVVTVVDEFGCIGSSDTAHVIVLKTRNKAAVQFNAGDGNVVIVNDHDIGTLECRSVTIRNSSIDEPLVISKPYLIGNVFFSVPQAQLPVVIAPGATAQVLLCASAVDTGLVEDTLAIPDTCSTSKIPIRSKGLPLFYNGTSRCSVNVDALVYRAGAAWRLTAPFPVPARDAVSTIVKRPQGASGALSALLRDVTGRVVGSFEVSDMALTTDITFDVSQLVAGQYMMMVLIDGETVFVRLVPVVR